MKKAIEMTLRPYQPGDCEEMAHLFYETVHTVNAADYSLEQLDAWASGKVDLAAWDVSFRIHHTLVAERNGQIVGFGDMDAAGYLDRLYVHQNFQRSGVATAICNALESACPCEMYTTHASITARKFFIARGYRIIQEQQVERRGVLLTNYVMEKPGPLSLFLQKKEKG